MPRISILCPVGACGLVLAMAAAATAQPSTRLNTYVLFAQDSIRIHTATVSDGDVGVNQGLLYLRGAMLAPKSDLVGDVAHLDSTTDCKDLFTNQMVGAATSCPQAAAGVPHPVFDDLEEACDVPPPGNLACSTDPALDRLVEHGDDVTLPPGTYRNLIVEGGGRGPAVLKLNGTYHFCNIRVGRNGSVLFGGPSTVTVAGSSRISNATDVGPDGSLGAAAPHPGAIKWFIQGSQARFSRKGNIALYACAPNAKMLIGSGTVLTGRFVARSIRMKKATLTFAPPVPGVCGDTVLSPDEQCEVSTDCGAGATCVGCACTAPPTTTTTGGSTTTSTTLPPCTDDEDCNPGSPGGTFVCEDGHCFPGCDDDEDCHASSPGGSFVCEDGHCVPGPTATSSTIVTSTTGPSTTTTSTTLRQCTTTDDCSIGVCREGVCVPECTSDDDCVGPPDASFVCLDGRCVAGVETCSDCLDNDGDGLVDFEDPDCCDAATGQLSQMDLRLGRVRSRATDRSKLRLKATLGNGALSSRLDPTAQQLTVQLRGQAGEVLCAVVPAGTLTKKGKAYRFSLKKTPVRAEVGRNLDRVQVKLTKHGLVRFRVKARDAHLTTPAEGMLRVTVGFTKPGTASSQNACSQAVRLFRGGKRGRLVYP